MWHDLEKKGELYPDRTRRRLIREHGEKKERKFLLLLKKTPAQMFIFTPKLNGSSLRAPKKKRKRELTLPKIGRKNCNCW